MQIYTLRKNPEPVVDCACDLPHDFGLSLAENRNTNLIPICLCPLKSAVNYVILPLFP